MGGFEGGDEGGFWDIDAISDLIKKKDKTPSNNLNKPKPYTQNKDSSYSINAHAKIHIFSKITGEEDDNFTLFSRVIRVEELYDTISFVPCKCESFTLEGCGEIPLEKNSIYKAYLSLCDYTADSDIIDFFEDYKVVVTKRIAMKSGLGASASDAASFLRLLKEVCNLIISTQELVKIANNIANDIAFFIYNYPSANVSGLGDIVEEFVEEAPKIEIHTSDVRCVQSIEDKTLKDSLLTNSSLSSFEAWKKLDSKSILALGLNPAVLNDFYTTTLCAYPGLKEKSKEDWFLSGYGSSFFTVTV